MAKKKDNMSEEEREKRLEEAMLAGEAYQRIETEEDGICYIEFTPDFSFEPKLELIEDFCTFTINEDMTYKIQKNDSN